MLPSKLRALNDCSTDESSDNDDAPVKITKEALETKAELQYSQALQCIARDQLNEAEEQLYHLLHSEIICSINTTLEEKNKSGSLLAHLKYCCLTNLGNLLFQKSKYNEALIHYQEALKMDSTDLNLWYRLGLTHSKLYQTDQAISAFLEGIKCNPNHWPTLDKLITLLYASNEYICCLYYINKSLNIDSGYIKGHFIKNAIFKKFPSLISYFKSYCTDGGLDVEYTDMINEEVQQKILDEIENIKENDPTLHKLKIIKDMCKPVLYANPLKFENWNHLGKWLLNIYDHLFNNFEHSLLYEPIEFNFKPPKLDTTEIYIFVDETYNENDFVKPSFKLDAPATKRRKSSPSITDHLKLSRRSTRNKANTKANESTLVKSVWDIMPQHLLLSKDRSDNLNINSIKWSDESMDTMDLYRLYEFSDMLSDAHTENLLKNNITDEDRIKQMKDDNYFGSNIETDLLSNFIKDNDSKSISNLLEMFLIIIANKWPNVWPSNMVQVYIDIFKRVWIHSEKHHLSYISDPNRDDLNDEQLAKIKNEIISILTYGELLCDIYFQLKTNQKPLDGSIIGGDFCSLWIGSITDAISSFDFKDDHVTINIRFLWLKAIFHMQDKEIGLTCDALNVLLDFIANLNDYEIILPNLEYFYRINKRIAEKLVITLKRNSLLNTVKKLYESKEYLDVVNILKETLKPQSRTFMEIPSYQTMSRYNQYIFMLNSFLELKNYQELFKWCEPCLYEAILQHRKSLIEDCDPQQKNYQADFINNIFYAMLESIRIEGLNVFKNLCHGYKSRLIQSVINLLSYLIETPDGNPEIDAVSPWLLIYNLLKYEESLTGESSFSSELSNIPQSLALLFLGHDYLGKRSWCCFEDGILLFLTLSEIEPFINMGYTMYIAHQVDQIFYCLYTHLIKRNKPRNVQDHHSMGLALTWPRARQLVNFYLPQKLPSYDGLSKLFTINSEIEVMLKKVIVLIPNEINPSRLIDDLLEYIKGETDKLPVNDNPLPDDVKNIFYLLADFNFKNKVWNKAVQYYLLDICNNFDRFDSWAAMALARGSQIETKLNSCESIKNEVEIIKRAHMTGHCYNHSLKLNPKNTTLLIEYGTFSYSIHSFCSRLLKQETSNMSLQMFGELEQEKEKMIKIARKCFVTANHLWESGYTDHTDTDFLDDRWMHDYILGKISEKMYDNSTQFMDYYIKAAQNLYSNGATFPEHITYTHPEHFSIEMLEIYYRIHAGALKLLEKHDNHTTNEELYLKIKLALDKISNMPPIANSFKEANNTSSLQVNNTDKVKKEDINSIIKQTLSEVINLVVNNDNEANNLKLGEIKKRSHLDNIPMDDNKDTLNHTVGLTDVSIKKVKLTNNSNDQNLNNMRWSLIQRCLAGLEECIKRFPQHYKSYYRLCHFYFRSPSHKDNKKFHDLMFGERGLFSGQKPHNFFQGIWRIPVSEIDRPGSFAYHMSRCVHLLLDFLKETEDYQILLNLAVQLKVTPDPDKKYLRDNEREGISKEALFLSIQILSRLKSDYAKTNNHSKNELFLIQLYKVYKRVYKCWQKDNKNILQLLKSTYQNVVDTKDSVSTEVIIKHCQKLKMREKEIEYKLSTENQNPDENINNNIENKISIKKISNFENKISFEKKSNGESKVSIEKISNFENKSNNESKSGLENNKNESSSLSVQNTNKSNTPSISTQIPFETQKLVSPQQVSISQPLPLNTSQEISDQIMSMLVPYSQSPLMYPLPLETCSYAYTLQQKLQATKQKLKRSNNKQKIESKRSTNNKGDKVDFNRSMSFKPKKNISNNKYSNLGNGKDLKSKSLKSSANATKQTTKIDHLEHSSSKALHISSNNLNDIKLNKNLKSVEIVEISKLPKNVNNKFNATFSPVQNPKGLKTYASKPKTSAVKMLSNGNVNNVKSIATKKTNMARNTKMYTKYIDLDSAAEQARLKSTIFQNKSPEKKCTIPVSLNPAMLLSTCPGLSITPVLNANDNNVHRTVVDEQSASHQIRTNLNSFSFEQQFQRLSNSLTITKSENNTSNNV